ncbi:MAG TPA: protein kinase [Bryobacteraceae bacterium]|nr:protein kinase [Bryobacteraceae bacterium]
MDDLVNRFFHEIADLGPAEREKFFADHYVRPEIRSEIESLLAHDVDSGHLLTASVAAGADHVLQSARLDAPRWCGPYRLIRLLGSGGMGAVYLAERSDGELQQQVAIKLLRTGMEQPSQRERFLTERQLLSYLDHPSVARLLDVGRTEDGRPYLVMEYVDGVPIDSYAAGKPLREQLAMFLKVCGGVAHAHRHLIIHRDLKPSNILVNPAGEPKLLDFGIAKLVDETADQTATVERLLTPNYASPEQLRGSVQTTATDVYSLGAVLYKLLTGRSPHQSETGASQALEIVAGARPISAPTQVNPNLPADVDYVLRKALRTEPEERYASVEAFASDIRALLDSRPVQARSADAWYQTRKFLRRHWIPALAASVVIASILAGLYEVNRQRAIAERRFEQLEQLSKKIFDLDNKIKTLPGSIEARKSLVSASLDYLEALAAEAHGDLDLEQDLAEGYERVALAQGVPTDPNLGQRAEAEASLKKADAFIEHVLSARPHSRTALFLSSDISAHRMILAQESRRTSEAVAHARKAADRIEQGLTEPGLSAADLDHALGNLGNIALAHTNMHMYAQAVTYARESIELTRTHFGSARRLSFSLSVLANALRYQGDLEGALAAIEEARNVAGRAIYSNPTARMLDLYGVLLRQGFILGEDESVNLARPEEAIEPFQAALDMTEQAAERDPEDSVSRERVGTSARELGNVLRHRDPQRALALYDLGLRRMGEIPEGARARRERAVLLAKSSYALRDLRRPEEARQRIDASIVLLTATGDYPARQVAIDSEAYTVMRALADDEAARGETVRGRETYQELLDKIIAGHPGPFDDLRDAPRLAAVYQNLAGLYRKSGDAERAATFDTKRLDLWQSWERKLPNNRFIQRQLAAR